MSVIDQEELTSLDTPILGQKMSKSFSIDTDDRVGSDDATLSPPAAVDCLGRHFIVDFYGCNSIDDIELMEQALTQASEAAGARLLHLHLHTFSDGGGLTGVALLAESHISVHTWPEVNYAAFDVFMCGQSQPEKAVALLQDIFKPETLDIKELVRGDKALASVD